MNVRALMLAVGTLLLTAWAPRVVLAQASDCRAGKKWYAGACRYPDEIEKMKRKASPKPARPKPPKPVPTPRPSVPSPPPPAPLPHPIPVPPPVPVSPPAPVPQPVPPPQPDPIAPATLPAPIVPLPMPRRRSVSISPLVWVGLGVAGAGAIVGAITGGVSFARAKDLQKTCADNLCPPEQQGDIDQMILLANVSNVSFAVAGAGAIVGIIGLAITDWSPSAEAASLRVEVTAGGARLLGTF